MIQSFHNEVLMKRPFYTDKNALERGITVAQENIKRFEEAIEKERETIFQHKTYIRELDEWNKAHNQQ